MAQITGVEVLVNLVVVALHALQAVLVNHVVQVMDVEVFVNLVVAVLNNVLQAALASNVVPMVAAVLVVLALRVLVVQAGNVKLLVLQVALVNLVEHLMDVEVLAKRVVVPQVKIV